MLAQVERWMDDYKYGRDYIDPAHVKDEGITHDDCRRWKVLQELQVDSLHHMIITLQCVMYLYNARTA